MIENLKQGNFNSSFEFINGDRGINYPSKSDFVSIGIPFINAGHISKNKLNFREIDFITEQKYLKLNSGKIKKNDILFCLRGSLGKNTLIENELKGAIASSLIILRPKQGYNAKYLFYIVNSCEINKQIQNSNSGSSQPNLSASQVKSFIYWKPDIQEQNIIGVCLSDIDYLIDNVEKLIEKKKLIKQGVMQDLLTGKKRLPGFSSHIINTNFKELNINVLKGETITAAQTIDGKYPVVAGGKKPAYFCNKYNREGTTITISASGANAGYVGLYRESIFASDCNTISESDNYEILYIYYLLLLHQQDLYYLQSGGAQPHIHPKDVYELKIEYINDKSEQSAIADILWDVDQEINLSEQDLEKYKQIKQGMMEQLLTGKIRLVEENDNVQTIPEKKHNQYFDDAVVFANIVASCYDPGYPLGRKKCQKMMYLFKRFNESSVDQFKHYAAGPYDNKARYGGFETIAIKNKYVVENKSDKGSSFAPGPEIEKAKAYCSKYGYDEFIPIFNQYLKYKKVDELELYTTVDKTILELKDQGSPINLKTVKTYISNDKTWVPKLSREIFNDGNIEEAIRFSQLVLGA